MKLGTRLKAVLFATGIGLSGAASANNYYFGDVTSTPAFFASGFVNHNPGAFTDDFFFSVSLPSYGGTTIADQPITSFLGTVVRNITGMTASFFFDGGTVGAAGAGDVLFGAPSAPSDYIHGETPLVPGNYYIQVNGNAVGASSVAGTYAYTGFVSSVPEPETYALMAAGILMMGVIARRRSTKI